MGAVVVFGATGGAGRHAVAQFLGAGQDVIAVVRDPAEGTPLANAGVPPTVTPTWSLTR